MKSQKPLKTYYPKNRLNRYVFVSIIYSTILFMFLDFGFNYSTITNMSSMIFYWFLWIMFSVFVLGALLLIYIKYGWSNNYPIIQIFANKVILEYKKIGTKITINRGKVNNIIIIRRRSSMNSIGIKFKSVTNYLNKYRNTKGKRNLISSITHYFVFKKYKISIKFKQFFSNKIKDNLYIAKEIMKINEKIAGFHIYFLEMFYSDNNNLLPNIKNLESKQLAEDLRKSLM